MVGNNISFYGGTKNGITPHLIYGPVATTGFGTTYKKLMGCATEQVANSGIKYVHTSYSPYWYPVSTSGKTGPNIAISGQTITSTVNASRVGVFFTSTTAIDSNVTSIKFQAAKGVADENIRFGIGNGDFDDNDTDPRNKILYSIYFTAQNDNNAAKPYIYSFDPTTSTQHSANLTAVVPWSSWYTENTIFEIRIDQNNVVSFYKGDVLLWAPGYTIDFTTPKYLMGSMWFVNGGVKNVEITGPVANSGITEEEETPWHPNTSTLTGSDIAINGQQATYTSTTLANLFFTSTTDINANVTSIKFKPVFVGVNCDVVIGVGSGFQSPFLYNDPRQDIEYGIWLHSGGSGIFVVPRVNDDWTGTYIGYQPVAGVNDGFSFDSTHEFEIRMVGNNISFYGGTKNGITPHLIYGPVATTGFGTTHTKLMGSTSGQVANSGIKYVHTS